MQVGLRINSTVRSARNSFTQQLEKATGLLSDLRARLQRLLQVVPASAQVDSDKDRLMQTRVTIRQDNDECSILHVNKTTNQHDRSTVHTVITRAGNILDKLWNHQTRCEADEYQERKAAM